MTAYTANLDAFGLSTLDLSFNALAVVDGVLLGCDEVGFFALDADTDEGEPIPFSLETGWTDGRGLMSDTVPSHTMKRVGPMYLEGTRCDRARVQFETAHGSGVYPARFFRAPPVPGAPAPARVLPAKGLRSVWWRFRIFGAAAGGLILRRVAGTFLLSDRKV